ncbi:hypothetical protein Cgig2_015697 [Carnegiea gigantea]|uniref:Uncharacterized protein n=1 Tax=Carnegiea gigantea TaxID=171969 RepID=A0A9Q1K0G7_9CARY|nr:hypothetical protein Cgig2_015697 [Carnegiea gigantea]
MAFPCFLNTKEMAEYIVRHFAWDRRGAACPLSRLPKNFQALCLNYELAMVEEVAKDYELPELPQLYGDQIFEARFRTKAEPEESLGAGQQEEGSEVEREDVHPPGGSGITGEERKQRMLGMPISPFIMAFPSLHNTRGMADYVRESFIWHWKRATFPSRLLPKYYHVPCPHFSLPEAKGAAADFELPEMVQVTFYAMLLNEAVELDVVRGFMVEGLKSTLVRLRWSSFEAWMSRVNHELREAQLRQWSVAMEVHGSSDEMVQMVFYAMVIDDAAELGLLGRLTMDCVMWAMRKLDWGPVEAWLGDNDRRLQRAQASRPTDLLENPVLAGGPSRGRTASFPSCRDTIQVAEYVRDSLRWSVKETSSLCPNLIPLHFTAYCPKFDHIVAMQFVHAAHIPETGESLMLDLWIIEVWQLSIEDKLKDAQVSSPGRDSV